MQRRHHHPSWPCHRPGSSREEATHRGQHQDAHQQVHEGAESVDDRLHQQHHEAEELEDEPEAHDQHELQECVDDPGAHHQQAHCPGEDVHDVQHGGRRVHSDGSW